MIYTVTFNPSLDYIVTVNDFMTGIVNRTSKEILDARIQRWDLWLDLRAGRLFDCWKKKESLPISFM